MDFVVRQTRQKDPASYKSLYIRKCKPAYISKKLIYFL